ncbi:pesticidal protein Cry7Aa [Candidatus Falkowbacteria bacterium CG_4_10_14_0_2_um_filter_48_10]|nr:MAG: pesticidal protein Cry7Aa [Candidatus Falkowbacteria bacterium CG_4_10_14_0_2_um_filter_48_10]
MIKMKREGVILRPTNLDFENLSVFNPGIYQEGGKVHVLYRALNDKFISCLGYARFDGPLKVAERWDKPLLAPRYPYEKKGVEDPRISKVGKNFYVVYVAHDGLNAVLAYAFGPDLFRLKRGGIISPRLSYKSASRLFLSSHLKDSYLSFASFYEKYAGEKVLVWEKDGVLFPSKIKRKFALLHRILPDIQIASFSRFSELQSGKYWREYIKNLSRHVVMEGEHGFENRHIGAGAPPIKTRKGWLIIYHAVQPYNRGRIYTAGAALLDLKNPERLLARLPYPLLEPEMQSERAGHVHNVVFPTGTSIFKGRLYIYYGMADHFIGAASCPLASLLKELDKYRK